MTETTGKTTPPTMPSAQDLLAKSTPESLSKMKKRDVIVLSKRLRLARDSVVAGDTAARKDLTKALRAVNAEKRRLKGDAAANAKPEKPKAPRAKDPAAAAPAAAEGQAKKPAAKDASDEKAQKQQAAAAERAARKAARETEKTQRQAEKQAGKQAGKQAEKKPEKKADQTE